MRFFKFSYMMCAVAVGVFIIQPVLATGFLDLITGKEACNRTFGVQDMHLASVGRGLGKVNKPEFITTFALPVQSQNHANIAAMPIPASYPAGYDASVDSTDGSAAVDSIQVYLDMWRTQKYFESSRLRMEALRLRQSEFSDEGQFLKNYSEAYSLLQKARELDIELSLGLYNDIDLSKI